MSQNTNVAIARSVKQVELLSKDKAKHVAEVARGLDLHGSDNLDLHGSDKQNDLRLKLDGDSKVSDIELTAWLVEFGGLRLQEVVGSIRLSSRDESTGEISPEQKRANILIGRANATNQA